MILIMLQYGNPIMFYVTILIREFNNKVYKINITKIVELSHRRIAELFNCALPGKEMFFYFGET